MKSRSALLSTTILALFAVLLTTRLAVAATINVPADKQTIQAAIDAAVDGDTVLVAPGTYKENISFKGKAITVTSTGDPTLTVIDGNQNGSVVTFNSMEGPNSVLNGFTIQNGLAYYTTTLTCYGSGGGINIDHSSPTITNNLVTNNVAVDGPGICTHFSSAIIRGNVISGNIQSDKCYDIGGGGILVEEPGTVQIIGNTISDNSIRASNGAGIHLWNAGSAIVRGNKILRNVVTAGTKVAQGGGIAVTYRSDALIVQNLIAENTATYGGGIYWLVDSGRGPYLVNNTIANNAGSAVYADGLDSAALLVNNVIVGKSGAAAVYCGSTYDASPPSFSHNVAFAGGGVAAYGGVCSDQNGSNGNITADPLLDMIGYQLTVGSPAIDNGDDGAPSLPTTDLGGKQRIVDGNLDGTATVDMGAYEFVPPPPHAVINGAPPSITLANSATLTISGTYVLSYRYSIDGGPYSTADTPVNTPITLTNLAPGLHTVAVIGKDVLGREQSTSSATIVSWTVHVSVTINVPFDKATIQAAIDAAFDTDTVLVAPGTYKENIDFKGKAITVTSTGDPKLTIIDGNAAGSVVSFVTSEGSGSVLNGFTVQNGLSSFDTPGFGDGGGILIEGASPTITNNRIVNNHACTGIGISVSFGSPLIQGNLISGNSQVGCSGGIGGGGISIGGKGTARILNNTITDNALPYAADGGGISLFAAGTPEIRGNIIQRNLAAGASPCAHGGGISIVNQSDALIVQNLITDNSAGCGGGVDWMVPSGDRGPYLINNTIANNTAPSGAAIYADGYDKAALLVNNVISSKKGQPAIYCGNFNDLNPPQFSHNIAYTPSGKAYDGTCTDQNGINGNITADPLLASITFGDYRLTTGSPAIDSGDGNAPFLPATDLVGNSRVIDGNLDLSAVVDMGAFEFVPPLPHAIITGAPMGATTLTSVTLTISGSDVLSYRYSIDGGSYTTTDTPVSTPLVLSNLTDGPHSVAVIGKGLLSREQPIASATVASWIVDTVAPVTFATPSAGSYQGLQNVVLTCNDGSRGSGCAAIFYCLGSGCTPTKRYDGGAIGIVASIDLRFFSTDVAGNKEAIRTESYTISSLDLTPPTITGFSVSPAYSNGLTVPVSLAASDNVGVTGYCLAETYDSAGCVWGGAVPASYTFSGYGQHTLYAFARDAAGNVSVPLALPVTVRKDFIPASQRVDMVYDTARDTLYISNGDTILRYRIGTQAFLSPYRLSGSLSVLDLSPDGNTLAVADTGLAGIHLIDLKTDTPRQVAFTPVPGEGGTYAVAFGADGAVLTSSTSLISGLVPLRRYDPATGDVKIITTIDRSAMLSASADGKCIGYAGGNDYAGPVGVYNVTQQKFTSTAGTARFNYEIGVNRDCSQLAVPTYAGTFVFNGALGALATVGQNAGPQPIGVAYHPGADIVYFAWEGTQDVRAFDTRTLSPVTAYNFDTTFAQTGNQAFTQGRLRISRDGGILFATVKDGVRFQRLTSAPVAGNQSVVVSENTPTAITLAGTSTTQAALTYQIVTSPSHGTITGNAPSLTYTPNTGFNGQDSFTFTVSDGQATSEAATVAISVVHDALPPVITSFTIPATSASTTVSVLTFAANDNLGVAGYCLTETDTPYGCNWAASAPGSYTFGSGGPHRLYAFARDASGNVSAAASALVTIALPQTPIPIVTGFSIPALSDSMTVAVTIAASDSVAVAGFCLTETNDPTVCVWAPNIPTSFTFGSYGAHTLYAFARNTSGNVSAAASASTTVIGQRNFISASGRADMVYDGARDIVYITSGGSVLRYRLASNTFLSPLQLGGTLSGLDLSPDGNTLAVADRSRVAIQLVDLMTGTARQVTFTPASGETGTYAVAFGADGALLVSPQSSGTGPVPLRRYDPATGNLKVVATVGQNAMLSASADGSCVAYAAANDSSGPFGVYAVATQNFTHTAATAWSNYEIAADRDCTQFAVPTYNGTYVFNGVLNRLATIGTYAGPQPIGAAYHPASDIVYFAWANTREVRAFDSKSLSQIASYDFGDTFAYTGNRAFIQGRLRMSSDGAILFATVKDGVRYQRITDAPVADDQAVTTFAGTPVATVLTGSSRLGAALAYTVVTPPAHGTLSGTAPYLTYTPNATYNGTDSFTFKASDGSLESVPATMTIGIHPETVPPVITSFAIPATSSTAVIPVVEFKASDNVGVRGYCISEVNSSAGCSWGTAPPVSYALTGVAQGVTSRTLYAFVRDASLNVSDPASATVVISIPDTKPPVIAGFTIPASSNGLTTTLTLIAADNVGVSGYLVTESTTRPLATDPGWVATSPTSFTFSGYGNRDIYAWAKDAAGNVSERSAAFVTVNPKTYLLTVGISGSGSGSVNSVPSGIACTSGTCPASFPAGTPVTLVASQASDSLFSGWSGACTNVTGDCSVFMTADKIVTAGFSPMPPLRIVSTTTGYFPTLFAAYAAVLDGSRVTIQGRAVELPENADLDRNVSVALKGGYNSSFSGNGGYTTLRGTLTVGLGLLEVDSLIVR
jgi:hypothetical protein